MSLNCLNRQVLQRTDSMDYERRCEQNTVQKRLCCIYVERSWSGSLGPPSYKQMRSETNMNVANKVNNINGHRRLKSTGVIAFQEGTGEPKLVRSCGMRRDWSFEDLRQRMDEMRKGGREF